MALPEFKGDDFEFPDEKETKGKATEKDDDFKVEIEDDTPPLTAVAKLRLLPRM